MYHENEHLFFIPDT